MRLLAVYTASIALLGCSLECPEIGCSSSLDLEPISYEGTLVGATVMACRNDACADGTITREPDRGTGTSVPLDGLSLTLSERGGERTVALDATFDASTVANGDVYTLSIVTPDGTEVVSERWTVDYELSQPNGPSCPPVCALGRAR